MRWLGAETVLDGFSEVREEIWRGLFTHPFVTDSLCGALGPS